MHNSIIISTMKVQMQNSFARKTFQFTLLAQPILYTCITYFMFLHSGIRDYLSYVVLGSGMLSLWSCVVFSSAGDIDREKWMGTLTTIFASPASFVKIVLAKILGNTILSLIPFGISFLIVHFVFREAFNIVNGLLFVIIFLFVILSFVAIAFLFSATFTLSRKASILMNCLEFPIFILCGFVFPLSILPQGIQYISYLLSPTWASLLLKQSVKGIEDLNAFIWALIFLLLTTILYFVIGFLLFRYMDKKVREEATLEVC